jgi:hypothetical protein
LQPPTEQLLVILLMKLAVAASLASILTRSQRFQRMLLREERTLTQRVWMAAVCAVIFGLGVAVRVVGTDNAYAAVDLGLPLDQNVKYSMPSPLTLASRLPTRAARGKETLRLRLEFHFSRTSIPSGLCWTGLAASSWITSAFPEPSGFSALAGSTDSSVRSRAMAPHDRTKTTALSRPSGLCCVETGLSSHGELHPGLAMKAAVANRGMMGLSWARFPSLAAILDRFLIVVPALNYESVSYLISVRPLKYEPSGPWGGTARICEREVDLVGSRMRSLFIRPMPRPS